jgi:hypothetical protein
LGGDSVVLVELEGSVTLLFPNSFSRLIASPGFSPGGFHEETPVGCSFVAANLPKETLGDPVVVPLLERPCRAVRA